MKIDKIFYLIAVIVSIGCSNATSLKVEERVKPYFDAEYAAGKLHTMYHKLLNDPKFYDRHQYKKQTVKYFTDINATYDINEHLIEKFIGQITKEEALKREPYGVYKVYYDNNRLYKAENYHSDYWYDHKERRIVTLSIGGNKKAPRFIYYGEKNIEFIECKNTSKRCMYEEYTYYENINDGIDALREKYVKSVKQLFTDMNKEYHGKSIFKDKNDRVEMAVDYKNYTIERYIYNEDKTIDKVLCSYTAKRCVIAPYESKIESVFRW